MEIIKWNGTYFDKFLELEAHCFGPAAWGREEWTEILSDEKTAVYLAVEAGELIAFLSIYNWGSKKNFVKITDIGTRADFRGRKIAHKLMASMMAEMEAAGMHAFAGETRVSNAPMQKVFADFGFRMAYIMEDYYDDPHEDAYRYHLRMELANA